MTKVMIPLNQKERRQSKLGIYRFYFRRSLTYGRKRLIDNPDNWNHQDSIVTVRQIHHKNMKDA